MYELFEHTADVGLRARAASLEDLLAEAARALFSLIVANLDEVQPRQTIPLALPAAPPDELLHDWLAELLYTFEVRRVVLAQFDVTIGPDGLKAAARGEPIDPQRHQLDMEVKAITWHGLKVVREGDGWLAEVIVDI
jgi:SHS2 domain-containing protein